MANVQKAESGTGRVAAAAQRGLTTAQTTPWLRSVGVTAWLILGVAGVLALALLLTALVAEVANGRLRSEGILGGTQPSAADDAPDGAGHPPAHTDPRPLPEHQPAPEVVETP
jgi:hypothetical protein